MPFYFKDSWDLMVNCWKCWCLNNMYSCENMRDWYLVCWDTWDMMWYLVATPNNCNTIIWTQEDVRARWRKLHNEEINNLYYVPITVLLCWAKQDEMGRVCSISGKMINCIQNFNQKIWTKRPLGDVHVDTGWRIILKLIFKK